MWHETVIKVFISYKNSNELWTSTLWKIQANSSNLEVASVDSVRISRNLHIFQGSINEQDCKWITKPRYKWLPVWLQRTMGEESGLVVQQQENTFDKFSFSYPKSFFAIHAVAVGVITMCPMSFLNKLFLLYKN